ncbi:MAG: hypothetical protein H6712_04265 [Myxococcales bacterium]|nr:hypothetical protein [Myxococcales bacterium]
MIVGATIITSASACSPLPDVKYETDRLRIAPTFDDPICEGTLVTLDDHLEQVEDGLGVISNGEPFLLYWQREDIEDSCGEGRGGCFFPASRVMFARGPSITHEMTHAVLDSVGESYFLEEGMAELLSGVGVYYDVDEAEAGPAERLRLSRSTYREGHFDYAGAAHFMRWIYDRRGVAGVRRLAIEVEHGAPPEHLEDALEQIMGMSIHEIEVAYRHDAKKAYEGMGYERTPELPVEEIDDDEESEGPESFLVTVAVDLECEAETTMGPLPEEREGMYQVRRFRVPENVGAVLRVEGDPGTWVQVFDPYARKRRGVMTDWMLPSKTIDHDALELRPGEVVDAELHPGVWAVVLGADGVASGKVSLEIELAAPPPPPDPGEWM